MKRDDEFVRGATAAANVAADYNSSTTHDYRLDDCILCKLNVIRRKKPRRNKRRLEHPDTAYMKGFAAALATVHKIGGHSENVVEAAKTTGATLAELRKMGVEAFDLRELKKAGVQ